MLGTRRSLALAAILLAASLAGCAKEAVDPTRVVAGDVEWARPANEVLQLQIVSAMGLHTVVDFARSEWHVAAIADAVARREFTTASVVAEEIGLFEEVRALDAQAPDLLAQFRLDRVQAARVEQGEPPVDPVALEEEWEERLEAIERGDAPAITVLKPGAPVPAPRVPAPSPPATPRAPTPPATPTPPPEEEPPETDDPAGAGEDAPSEDAQVPDVPGALTEPGEGVADATDAPVDAGDALPGDDTIADDIAANESAIPGVPTLPTTGTGLFG